MKSLIPGYKALALFCVVALVGCGGSRKPAPTSAVAIGQATLDGRPITGGMITIVSINNPRRRATGMIRPDGTFRLAGAPIGKSQVLVNTTVIRAGNPAGYMPIPWEYSYLDTTDLEVELEAGDNEGVEIQCSDS